MSEPKKAKASSRVIKNLTSAGGSGSVRLIPVESAKKSPVEQVNHEKPDKPKKVYCPKIPTGRRMKKELTEKDLAEKPVTQSRPSNVRKERQRVKKEIVQSESVFSHGPAGKLNRGAHSRGLSTEKISQGHGGAEKTFQGFGGADKNSLGFVGSEVKVKEEEDFEQLTGENPLDLFSHSKLPPVCVPLRPNVFSQQKPLDLPHGTRGSESRIALDTHESGTRDLHSPADTITNGSHMLIKLPNLLPKSASPTASDSNAAANNETQLSGALDNIPEGCIGKLRIHKSGRTRLILGELSLEVSLGTPCGFLQELVSIQLSPDARITQLGHVSSKLCCIPEFENALS